jgi:plasmid stabilization system protein ParE
MTARFAPCALADINAIRVYLMERSPRGAENVRRAIASAIDFCSEYPLSGLRTDAPGVLRHPLHRYRFTVFYRLTPEGSDIEVLRVLRSARIKNLKQIPDDAE